LLEVSSQSFLVAVAAIGIAEALLIPFLFRVREAGSRARQSLDVGEGVVGRVGRWYAGSITSTPRSMLYHSLEGLSIPTAFVLIAAVILNEPLEVLHYTWWFLPFGFFTGMIDGRELYRRENAGSAKGKLVEDEDLWYHA
jgi:hypothetical protein